MLSAEESAHVLGVEREVWRRRARRWLPWLVILFLIILLRSSRWAGGPLRAPWTLVLAVIFAGVIAFLFWYQRRWLQRLQLALQGESALAQGEITAITVWDVTVGAEKFLLARALLADAQELSPGDRVEVTYLPGMRLAVQWRKL